MQSALNASINSTIGDTPHFVLYGVDKRLPYDLLLAEPRPVYNYDDIVQVRFRQSQAIFNRVRRHLECSTEKMLEQQHKRARNLNIDVGSLVYVLVHDIQTSFKKLSEKFEGPYRVIAPETGNKWRIKSLTSGSEKVVHVDHLKTVKDSNLVRPFPTDHTQHVPEGDTTSRNDMAKETMNTSDRVLRSHRNKSVIATFESHELEGSDHIKKLMGDFDDVDINLYGFYS